MEYAGETLFRAGFEDIVAPVVATAFDREIPLHTGNDICLSGARPLNKGL